jgi:hypothetical protein
MNTKLSIVVILAITAFVATAATATVLNPAPVDAQGGPKAERNHGQCKQEFNDNPCKRFHTGGN